jgi:hypothetical protein
MPLRFSRPDNTPGLCKTPWRIVAFSDLYSGFSETRASARAASCPVFRDGIAVPQSVRERSKTRHQRFDFRRDLRFTLVGFGCAPVAVAWAVPVSSAIGVIVCSPLLAVITAIT